MWIIRAIRTAFGLLVLAQHVDLRKNETKLYPPWTEAEVRLESNKKDADDELLPP